MLSSFLEFKSGCSCRVKKGHLMILPEFTYPPITFESIYKHSFVRTNFNGWIMNYSNKAGTVEAIGKDLKTFFERTRIFNLHVICHGSSHVLLKYIPNAVKIILIDPSFSLPIVNNNNERFISLDPQSFDIRIKRGMSYYDVNIYNSLAKDIKQEDFFPQNNKNSLIILTRPVDMNIIKYYPNSRIEEIPLRNSLFFVKNVYYFINSFNKFV